MTPFRSRQWPVYPFWLFGWPIFLLLALVGSRWVRWL